MLDKIIFYSFAFLFFFTPLFWTPLNYELFEFNKMILVYLLTTIITTAWTLKIINQKSLIFNHTPLDIPILLFLLANILSTIFSIDPHLSWWGYYSRLNGGLFSIVSYTLLYFALTSNLDKEQVIKLLKLGLMGGAVVSLWAIPEHFGVSPSCVILRGEFNASCWVQDVQARVFASLGQPNWLAAYLSMLIFPAIYFLQNSVTRNERLIYGGLAVIYYLAFTFTYSRGGMFGFIAGLLVFLLLLTISFTKTHLFKFSLPQNFKQLSRVILIFLAINIIFGSALTRFQLSDLLPKTADPLIQRSTDTPATGTQLETGGTESGQIRLIVWRGALEIFKHYPVFGSGVETFATSYYLFRPIGHNLVSEWDFLYNKAHNEYLNYLANTGIAGFGAYSVMIITFVIFILKKPDLLSFSLLASYISYLVQNLFGFSVVIIALMFYLFPAITFVATNSLKPFVLPKLLILQIFTKALTFATLLVAFYLTFSIIAIWYADTLFAQGMKASDNGNAGRSYNLISAATKLNSSEPFYKNELGYAAAAASLALVDSEATLSSQLKEEAVKETEESLKISPKNVSFYRTAVRTYFLLSEVDESFFDKTLKVMNEAIKLAPTDAKLHYNKAIIFGQADKNQEAIESLKKAVELKPNYREGHLALGLFYFDQKDYKAAISSMEKVLQLVPNDPEALSHLNEWGLEGIATKSAEQ